MIVAVGLLFLSIIVSSQAQWTFIDMNNGGDLANIVTELHNNTRLNAPDWDHGNGKKGPANLDGVIYSQALADHAKKTIEAQTCGGGLEHTSKASRKNIGGGACVHGCGENIAWYIADGGATDSFNVERLYRHWSYEAIWYDMYVATNKELDTHNMPLNRNPGQTTCSFACSKPNPDSTDDWKKYGFHYNSEGTNDDNCEDFCNDYHVIPSKEGGEDYTQTSHYTQLVHQQTYKIGCALATCDGTKTYLACLYDRVGNQERDNKGIYPYGMEIYDSTAMCSVENNPNAGKFDFSKAPHKAAFKEMYLDDEGFPQWIGPGHLEPKGWTISTNADTVTEMGCDGNNVCKYFVDMIVATEEGYEDEPFFDFVIDLSGNLIPRSLYKHDKCEGEIMIEP